nr:hypothetical protein [Tanacetum cinerariifolium]
SHVLSESHATVTYTSISSVERSWSISAMDPYEEATLQAPEKAPPSPDYVLGPEYPEYLAPSDDEIPDPEEDLAGYPVDGGDDDEEESSEDDDDDKEKEEHLASTDSTIPAIYSVPSVKEIEPFETDEFVATPPPPRSP